MKLQIDVLHTYDWLEWVLGLVSAGYGCIVTRFLLCTWKCSACRAAHCAPPPHTVRRRRVVTCHCCSHIFLLNSSVIPLMGIFLCEIRKFYASLEKQAESWFVAWRKSTALPTERRPFFLSQAAVVLYEQSLPPPPHFAWRVIQKQHHLGY